jgi:hypothetical protein
MQDGIDDLGSKPGDSIESIIQRLTLIITNPLCVDWNPGSGGGGGAGGGIIQVGLVAPSNLFETPIVPVTTPGGDLTLTLNDQASNTVFAGPTSGPDGTPQFRALVVDDLPDLTTGDCVLRGDGAGKFACVTIGPNLSYSGGVLDANVNVVIGAENGLTKDPVNTDTVWLGGPSTAPGILDFDTFIDTTDQFRLNLYGDNPAVKRGVLEVEHTLDQVAIKATADDGTAVSANIINGVTAVYASSTGSGIGLTAESSAGTAIIYTSTTKAGIIGDSADENIFTVNSTTPPNDSAVSSVLRLTKNYNSASAAGIGSRLDFGFYNPSATDKTSSTIASVATTVTAGAETADLRFSTIGNGTVETVGEFIGGTGASNGQFRLNKYGINTFNVGTPVYGLAVDVQGKVMEVPLASGIGTVNNGLRLNPSLASEAWLGGTLVDDTTITVPDGTLFEISGATVTAGESVLEINNTAGATGTRALSISSGGLEPAVQVTQNTTATSSSVKVINDSTNASAYGLDVETKSLPIWARTTQSANTTQVQLLKLHNQTGGSGGNGVGGYISLNAATVGNADQEAARIGYQFTDAATSTRKGQLEFYTANGAAPAQRMTIKETGQIQFNNYTTSTSFTTVVGASLLGVDTSGNVVNSLGKEGLLFNSTTGNIELGYTSYADSVLAGNQFSVDRFISTGNNRLEIYGTPPTSSDSVIYVKNDSTAANANYGIWSQNSNSANRNAYTIFGQGGNVGGGVLATTGNVLTGDGARSFAGSFGTISSDSTPSQLIRTPLNVFSTRIGGGIIGHGAQTLYTLSNDASVSYNAGTIGYESTGIVNVGAAETSKFFVSVKESGNGTPVRKLEINTAGQLKLNNYTSATSFTSLTGISLLAVDSGGNVFNSIGTEGLAFNSSTGNIELGRSALAGTSDFTGSRYINAGTSALIVSGSNSSAISYANPVLQIDNTYTGANVGAQALKVTYTATPTSSGGQALLVTAGSNSGSTYSNIEGLAVRTLTSTASVGITQLGSGGAINGYATSAITAVFSQNNNSGSVQPAIMAWKSNGRNNAVDAAIQINKNGSAPVSGFGSSILYTLKVSNAGNNVNVGQIAYSFDTDTTLTNYNSKYTVSVFNAAVETVRLEMYGADIIKFTQNIPGPYADDTAASAGGVPQYALYRDASSNVKICQI